MPNQIKASPRLQQLKSLHPTAHVIFIIFAIIMIWRGVWGLLDTYLFPGSPTLSHLTTIALGVAILYLDDFKIDNLKK